MPELVQKRLNRTSATSIFKMTTMNEENGTKSESAQNMEAIGKEIDWFKKVLNFRIYPYVQKALDAKPELPREQISEPQYKSFHDIPIPDLSAVDCPYSRIIQEEQLGTRERLVVILALMPQLEPQALDVLFAVNPWTGKRFAEFGGRVGPHHPGLIPTVETALFLLGGAGWLGRQQAEELFRPENKYPIQQMLDLQSPGEGAPAIRGILALKKTYASQLIEGKPYYPRFSREFPASPLSTSLSWDDLVLNPATIHDLEDILRWMNHNDRIAEEGLPLKDRIRQGYRTLFYGPPGTGKTLTATLLGQMMNRDVLRVDASQVVSKFIGETEKNLANVFDHAEDQEVILFFDEADAIFGKRVKASSSNDQHSNQQISYLLQRIETYRGVVVLATNFKSNIDQAFSRRFQAIVHFQMPNQDTRLKLWHKATSPTFPLAEDVDLRDLSSKVELTGGMIVNVLHYALLRSMEDNLKNIPKDYLSEGIRKEFAKEGKTTTW